MEKKRIIQSLWLLLLCLIYLLLSNRDVAFADPNSDNPRNVQHTYTATLHEWSLSQWDGEMVCILHVDHEEPPTSQEVFDGCDSEVYQTWITTPACPESVVAADASQCEGLTLHYLGQTEVTYTEEVELPPAEVHVALGDCSPGEWCQQRPSLYISGYEPVEGYAIAALHLQAEAGDVLDCQEATCEIELPLIDPSGAQVEFWAVSNFGDEGSRGTFYMRVVPVRGEGPRPVPVSL